MMNKNLIVTFLLTFICNHINAQQKCGYTSLINYYNRLQPGYKEALAKNFEDIKVFSSDNERANSDSVFTVQVVVHVVYKTPSENIPDSVIYNQIAILNQDYSRTNADTVNLRQEFYPIKAKDSKIRFALASTDPQGNSTTGIIRKLTTKNTFFDILSGGLAEGVKSSAEAGSDPWNQSKYLNIWVCNMSILGQTLVLGYATPPSGLPNWDASATDGLSDGVVIQYQYFGSNNPNQPGIADYIVKGRTVTHEVGHYLGMRHIWGDGTGGGACDGDDGIDDTPNADEASSQTTACNSTTNSCTQPTLTFGDLSDMSENYMDYSGEHCQNTFTKGQAEFMHNVVVTKRRGVVKNTTPLFEVYQSTFKLFPNPATNFFSMQFDKNLPIKKVEIFDLLGNLQPTIYLRNNSQNIDVSNLNSGFYTIKVALNNGRIIQQKLCINR